MTRPSLAFAFLLLQAAFILASTAPDTAIEAAIEHNCLADVIHAAHRLQRRSEGEFGYDGENGPDHWADLSPQNALCRSGKYQSPINFQGLTFRVNSTKAPYKIDWERNIKDSEFLNEGVTGKVILPANNRSTLLYKGVTYKFVQFHFHTPAEHHVDHDGTDGEVHFVHLSDSGKILVLGAFLTIDPLIRPNDFISQLLPYLPVGPKETTKTIPHLFLKSVSTFFLNAPLNSYEGSLTTPPCTEGVRFFVAAKPMYINLHQFKELKKVVKFNARFTMPINGRTGK